MTATRMNIIFDIPDDSAGIPVPDLNETVKCVQNAVLLMAAHLAGVATPGRPPEWLRRQSTLRTLEVSADTHTVALGLPPADIASKGTNYGEAALAAVLGWNGRGDRVLPRPVVKQLSAIGRRLSPDVSQVWLRDAASGMSISVGRADRDDATPARPGASDSKSEEALLYGRLLAVNWQNGTAHLHRVLEPTVVLRFEASLDEAMRQLAARYVKVRGIGRIDRNDRWGPVAVREIVAERSAVDDFYAREPKIFDPERAKATPFYRDDYDDGADMDEFIRIIHGERDS